MSTLAMSPAAGAGQPHRDPHHHHHHTSRPVLHRRGSTSHGSAASTSSLSDDEDAITPCPPLQQQKQPQQKQHGENTQEQHPRQRAAQRTDSWRSSQVMHYEPQTAAENEADIDPETLWRRMLAIQRMFGCYNSARMRAALDVGGEGFIPSKTCLDLLNDSIDQLPEESKRQLDEYLEHGNDTSSRMKSWRQRLLYMSALH